MFYFRTANRREDRPSLIILVRCNQCVHDAWRRYYTSIDDEIIAQRFFFQLTKAEERWSEKCIFETWQNLPLVSISSMSLCRWIRYTCRLLTLQVTKFQRARKSTQKYKTTKVLIAFLALRSRDSSEKAAHFYSHIEVIFQAFFITGRKQKLFYNWVEEM